MRKTLAFTAALAAALAFSPATLAKKGGESAKADKVFACKITGMNFEGTRYTGHVIHVSANSLGGHCDANPVPAHRPIGVINNAVADCGDDETSRCVIKAATGQSCSRGVGAQGPVNQLCGT